ncbi:P2Y purinoceptor 3-like isoform X1 [Brienomyrus brachyistius]|uniref:P2Y purinoceptor 3-like isoform X1 n=1 Tax=Brienomyrus brachyistius TaxID=42636 RepID=UPI0020B2450C|nr:P2Y purinoceptor 3-like isoform X1 [Brienomyrus brachyistius]
MPELYEDVNGKNVEYCHVPDEYRKIFAPLMYGFVFVLGMVLNGTLLCLVCCTTKSWSCSVIYLVNLAVADLLYVLTLPLLIISHAMEDAWPFGDTACRMVRFSFSANLHSSMMFLMCISVHRYLGVCYPIKAVVYKTKRIAAVLSTFVWIVVATELLPTFAFTHTGIIKNVTVCFDLTSPGDFHQYLPYGLFTTVVCFLIPTLVIFTCYCSMVKTLLQNQANIQVGQEIRRKSARTIIIVCLLFGICFVPHYITKTMYLFLRTYLINNCNALQRMIQAYVIWRPIVSFNSCINPILYFASSKKYPEVLLSQLFKTKVHPSVQSETDSEHGNINSGMPQRAYLDVVFKNVGTATLS